ncbi:hypothetical protein [Streptomyces sp. NBC_01240]|uniref:hypothetical protein n=1 Tax=Streptomyces sp. NBC_01240 TaxID=2903793 RepID=UPI002E153B6A|nr:hypothetical protein OG466_41310 [Streptomyces sp. NBC_01240]
MSAPLTPEREAEYRALIARTTDLGALGASPGVLQELLAELDRVRAELADRQEDLAFLHRNTLPELRRESQRHEDGKKRWRDRAEKAEAALAAKPAEALREAADQLALELTGDGGTLPGYPLAVRTAVRILRRKADEAATS